MDQNEFWKKFFAEYWGKAPVLIPSGIVSPLACPGDFFESLQRASDDYLACRRDVALQFYLDRGLRMADFGGSLPKIGDAGFLDYGERLAALHGASDVTLTLYGAQYYCYAAYLNAREFLRGLYKRLAYMPAGHVDLDIFFGRYAVTPSGIHRDDASNFSFIIEGSKNYLFWREDDIPQRLPGARQSLGSTDWNAHAQTAIRIQGQEGDVIYWPHSYWHVAVEQYNWCATANLALYERESLQTSVASFLAQPALTEFRAARPKRLPVTANDIYGLEHEFSKSAEIMRSQLSRPRNAALIQRLAAKYSSAGFEVVPPPQAFTLAHENVSIVLREHPILISYGNEGLLAANGHVARIAPYPALARVVSSIPLSTQIPLRRLHENAQEHAPDLAKHDVFNLVTLLVSLRIAHVE